MDTFNGDGTHTEANATTTRLARSEGVASYRRRRRRAKLARLLVALILLVVLGGAALLFGRSYFDYSGILANIPHATSEQYKQEAPGVVSGEDQVITQVQPVEIKLVATGDIIMNNSVLQSGRNNDGGYDFSHLFANVAGELQGFDVRVAGQETSMAGSTYGFGYTSPLNAPQELGRAEVSAGFTTVLRASDHTLDVGEQGIHNELLWWHTDYPDVAVLGISEPDQAANPGLGTYAHDVYIYEKDGFKVALLNHTWGVDEQGQRVVSALTPEKVAADVAAARDQGAEMIVAFPHWGAENSYELTEEETSFAQLYADQGVDVVIGSHPRVLQGATILEGPDGHRTVCFYSLGCFVSSLNTDNLMGGLAEVTLNRADDGTYAVTSAVLKPVLTHRANGADYSTYLVSSYTDELAYSSWDSYLTRDEVSRRLGEAWGEQYNAETCEYRVV